MWLLLIFTAKLVYSEDEIISSGEEKEVIETFHNWKGAPSVCKYASSLLAY